MRILHKHDEAGGVNLRLFFVVYMSHIMRSGLLCGLQKGKRKPVSLDTGFHSVVEAREVETITVSNEAFISLVISAFLVYFPALINIAFYKKWVIKWVINIF